MNDPIPMSKPTRTRLGQTLLKMITHASAHKQRGRKLAWLEHINDLFDHFIEGIVFGYSRFGNVLERFYRDSGLETCVGTL
jgi:hypothetical protein